MRSNFIHCWRSDNFLLPGSLAVERIAALRESAKLALRFEIKVLLQPMSQPNTFLLSAFCFLAGCLNAILTALELDDSYEKGKV